MTWRLRLKGSVGELSLDVELQSDGEPVALVGPNGAGKTTVLRWMAGRDFSGVSGELEVDGAPLHGLPPEGRNIGYLPQGYGLFAHLRVVDNVAFGLATRGTSRAERRARARALLDELECGALAARRPATLSGGEQQKVALARALAIEPRLLLLDEPMAALDAGARRRTRRFLAKQLAARRAAALLVTHDARDVRALARRVYVMEGGQIVQHGSPEELASQPATDFVAELFDAPG